MIRLVAFLLVVLAVVAGLHWLADRPGSITVEWQGYIAETSVFLALIILGLAIAAALVTWSLLRQVWRSPATMGRYIYRRRQKRGLDALTSGIIAVGAGDRGMALRYAAQARKALPHEPLTHLLRAQVAQIGGDRATARRIFEAMLASPDTEQLGLRGLFLEAEREGEHEAARQFAERALEKNPKLGWAVEALFDLNCRAQDWQGALDTLESARRLHLIEQAAATRRRAVLLTALAQQAEDGAPDRALTLAQEAHRLAPDLVPAAAIAGRLLAARGHTPRAARVLLKTWRLAPHPDLAAAYAYARPGDSPRDRLARARHLARLSPNHAEAQIALAIGAIEAREWEEARAALEPLIDDRLTPRVCTLMARIEGEENSDAGRVREWLGRAVTAQRDPAWTADGVVSDHWLPVSPVTGALDAFQWRQPAGGSGAASASLAARVDALIALAGDARPAAAAEPATIEVAEPLPQPPAPALPPTASPPPAEPEPVTLTPIVPASQPPPDAPPAHQTAAARVQPAAPKPAPVAKPAPRKVMEPKVFVSPRPPDDPGTDPLEGDGLGVYPASGAKA